jgi:MATE family multidrug resistance protein
MWLIGGFVMLRALRTEAKPILRLAVPIILGQLGQMMMPLADAAMVGRLGVVPLAAVAFGNLIVWVPMIMGFGLCVAVHVLVASAHGEGHREEAGEVLRHGIAMAVAYGVICAVALHLGMNLLSLIPRVDPAVIDSSKPYIAWMGWSIIPMLAMTVVKNYCESLNRPWLALGVLGVCIVLNVGFNFVLIYGNFGVPALGVAGAGLGTLLARSAGFVIALGLVWRSAGLRPEWRAGAFGRLAAARLGRLLALGGPSAAQILFEVSLFNFATLLCGMISTVTMAAHQIALNVASVAYMGPLGISMAAGIRVSQAMGGGRYGEARRIAGTSLALSLGMMVVYVGAVLATRTELPALFLRADASQAQAVFALAATLLAWAASFAVFDGVQITTLGVLRGMHDVRVPTALLFTGYWAVSAPLAWYLGMKLNYGGPGVWAGLLTGLIVVAGLLVGRLVTMQNRLKAGEKEKPQITLMNAD